MWSFKRKRKTFIEIFKNKSRLCVHGGMLYNTFAPIVNWSTVRLIIMMAKMTGWESRKIDYIRAFYQAPIGSDVYLCLSEGFHVNGTITLSQLEIFNKILNSLGICDESKMHDIPVNAILTKDKDVNGRNQEWHYHPVIGQMNDLSGTTRPDCFLLCINVQSTSWIQNNHVKELSKRLDNV